MLDVKRDRHIVLDSTLIGFYRRLGEMVSLHQDDMDVIFDVQFGPATALDNSPTTIHFSLQDEHPASFDCSIPGNTMMLSGDNQRNKTTSLLAIATLLGYSWDDVKNLEFLGDEEFVKKGRSIRNSIREGRYARLEITRGQHQLGVDIKDGEAQIKYKPAEGVDEMQTFDLRSGWTQVERYLSRLIDVQLVSKGRMFIQQVEADILDDTSALAEVLIENSQHALQALTLRSSGPIAPQQSSRSLDQQAIASRKASIRAEYGDLTKQRAYIESIRANLRELGEAHRVIEDIYRLELKLKAAKEARHVAARRQEAIRQREAEVERLGQEIARLQVQKQAVDQAFVWLRESVTRLLESRRVREVPENLLMSIRVKDVQGVFDVMRIRLSVDSIKLYERLIQAIENIASEQIPLLPLGEIRNSAALLTRLKGDMETAADYVVTNDLVDQFMQRLQQSGVELGMTPSEYLDLEREIADYAAELSDAEAELAAFREDESPLYEDVASIEKQVQIAEKKIHRTVSDVRERVEETAKNLEGDLETHLKNIWSSGYSSYLQQLETSVTQRLHRLRVEQQKLDKQLQHEAELVRVEESAVEDSTERADAIQRFYEALSYIRLLANARSDDQRKISDVQDALRYLDEIGVADMFKVTVDNLILQRCRFYYVNSLSQPVCTPLQAILHEQLDRETTKFVVDGREMDRASLSGGTESAMTVRSLASRPSAKPFGVALLVDEWGDVERIGEPLFQELREMTNILIAVFVKVTKSAELTAEPVN